jgi:hypothetical protein
MAIDPVSIAMELGGKLLERLWPDPVQREVAKIELVKMEQSGELAKMANETEGFKLAVADLASARDREARIATADSAPYINKVITPWLAVLIITGVFGGMLLLVFLIDGELKPDRKDIIIYILGALTAMGTQVISYYFGSSRGDAAKDQTLRDMMKK